MKSGTNLKPCVEFTPALKRQFVEQFRKTGLRAMSAEFVGVTLRTVRNHIESDEDFKAEVEEAYASYCDSLNEEIHRRAVTGWDEVHVTSKGDQYTIQRYSDRMLELLAKRHMPEYREGDRVRVDATVTGAVAVASLDYTKLDRRQRDLVRELVASVASSSAAPRLVEHEDVDEDAERNESP